MYSRSARVFSTGAQVVVDYRRNLRGTPREDPAYRDKLAALNQRVADRLLRLCFLNGGIYTKFGQQLATFNHGLPKEYTQTLAQLQDQARPVPFDVAKRTVEQELGGPWTDAFREFDRQPIAAASLAQVHHAVDRRGREVAVKVQYPHLEAQMRADMTVMRWAVQLTEYFFPDLQIQWMFPEFERALAAEVRAPHWRLHARPPTHWSNECLLLLADVVQLNFDNEKQNSRRIAECLKHNPAVHVPVVYDELSSRRMLTMEFIHAPKISQVGAISELGLEPSKVAHVLCEVFSEMIFCHGFVHCDPHAGNIFVRANPDPSAPAKEQLVLLDHGLYRELDEDFRKTYCDLWRAMLLRDSKLLQECGDKLKVGELVQFLPLMFTYRPISHKGRLDESMTQEEREKIVEKLKGLRAGDVRSLSVWK